MVKYPGTETAMIASHERAGLCRAQQELYACEPYHSLTLFMRFPSSLTTDANKERDDETEGAPGTTMQRWTQRRRHYKEGKKGRIGKQRALLSSDGQRGLTSLAATIDQHHEWLSEVFHGCIARAVPKLRRVWTNGSVIHRDIGIEVTEVTNGFWIQRVISIKVMYYTDQTK